MTNNKEKLTTDQRREIILSALSGAPVLDLSKEYGVARSWIYVMKEEAETDPETKLEEAAREAAFREKVLGLLYWKGET